MLQAAGHDAAHVAEFGLLAASDEKVLGTARMTGRVVLSDDLDFGRLLREGHHDLPSVVLFRGVPRSDDRIRILLDRLDDLAASLHAGAVVTLGPGRTRVRRLPLG